MILTYPFFLSVPDLDNYKKLNIPNIINNDRTYIKDKDSYKIPFENSSTLININEFNIENIDRKIAGDSLVNFANKILNNSKPLDNKIQKIVNEEFWNLI